MPDSFRLLPWKLRQINGVLTQIKKPKQQATTTLKPFFWPFSGYRNMEIRALYTLGTANVWTPASLIPRFGISRLFIGITSDLSQLSKKEGHLTTWAVAGMFLHNVFAIWTQRKESPVARSSKLAKGKTFPLVRQWETGYLQDLNFSQDLCWNNSPIWKQHLAMLADGNEKGSQKTREKWMLMGLSQKGSSPQLDIDSG